MSLCDKVQCLSNDGSLIYSGSCDERISKFFTQNFGVQIPKFCNPSDFLIKLAHDPKLVSRKLTTTKLNLKSEVKHSLVEEKAKTNLFKFIKAQTRSAPVLEQLKQIFLRLILLSMRSPKVMLSLFGISVFVSFLISSVYSGVGALEMNLFDRA